MRIGGVAERVAGADPHVELAVGDPCEQVVGAALDLVA